MAPARMQSRDLGGPLQWRFGMLEKIPSGYLTVCHGIDDLFIDGLPIINGDFPWLC